MISAVPNQQARSMTAGNKLDNSKASGGLARDALGEIEGMLKTKAR